MRPRQVDDVDEVADARPVGRVVVVAEDPQLRPDADGGLRDVGHEVVGDARGQLADERRRVRADGVEVAQGDHAQGVPGGRGVAEDLLADALRVAVGGGGREQRRLLRDGEPLGLAVDGAGGGKDDGTRAVRSHRLEEVHERDEVVAVVRERLLDRFRHGLGGGEVDDGVDRRVRREAAVEPFEVLEVEFLEGGPRPAMASMPSRTPMWELERSSTIRTSNPACCSSTTVCEPM